MKKKLIILLGFVLYIFLFNSCNYLLFKDVPCRDFKLTGENYWFPASVGDSVIFQNTKNQEKNFVVIDKYIYHRTEYTSDTGCGCLDKTGMLLTNNTDSIWFNNTLRYVNDQKGKYNEDVYISINNKQSGFFETHKGSLESFTIDSLTFNDVEKFEYEYKDSLRVKTLYRIKDLGVIQFKLVNGEIWTNKNLTNLKKPTKSSFVYTEDTCK